MNESGGGYTYLGRKGDLDLYVTDIKFPDDHEEHTALYIRNAQRKPARAFVLPFRDFWEFRPEDKDRGRWTSYAAMRAQLATAAEALYGDESDALIHRIHDAILEFADDVKNAKPPPGKTLAQVEAELDRYNVKFIVDGQRIR